MKEKLTENMFFLLLKRSMLTRSFERVMNHDISATEIGRSQQTDRAPCMDTCLSDDKCRSVSLNCVSWNVGRIVMSVSLSCLTWNLHSGNFGCIVMSFILNCQCNCIVLSGIFELCKIDPSWVVQFYQWITLNTSD